MVKLSVIIVNYNVKEFLLNSVSSIKKAADGIPIEIIVVDNASEDGSVEALRQKFPDVKIIANKENVGFGKANNQGLEIAQGEYVLLLNPDTLLKDNTLTKMLEFMDAHTDTGLATCKVLNPDGTLQLACRRSFPRPWVSFTKIIGLSSLFPKSKLFAKYNLTYLDENETYEVDAVSGSFMFLRGEAIKSVGGFDPDFFMYGEDLDLCYRIKEKGWKVYYYPETEIIHYKGESAKRSSIDETRLFYNAMSLFVEKHFSSSWFLKAFLKFAIVLREWLAFANRYKLAIIPAIIDFVFFALLIWGAENFYRNVKPNFHFPEEIIPAVYILPALFQLLVSSLTGVYKRNSLSVGRTILALLLGMILISAGTFFFKQYAFSRAVVLITYSSAIVIFALYRIIAKLFFKVGITNPYSRKRTIIAGTNENAIALADKIKKSIHSRDEIYGLAALSIGEIGEKIGEYEVVASLENLNKIIDEKKIDKVIFTADIPFAKIFETIAAEKSRNVEFLIAGDELDYIVGKSAVTILEDISLLQLHYNLASPLHRFAKRTLDVTLSLAILVFVYPFVILASDKNSTVRKLVSQTPAVLFGKKSLIGAPESFVKRKRTEEKAGVTGLWFLENVSENNLEELEKLDLYYAKNHSVWLDLDILGKTILKLVNGE